MVYENDGQLVGLLSLSRPHPNFFFCFSDDYLMGKFSGISNILVIQRYVLGTLV
jgi:hypothetical protein